jgi:hypothetical protein
LVSFDFKNKHCLYFFEPIQDRLKAASYPGLKKGCFPSDNEPNGYLKGTIMKRDKSSNVTSWEVAWNYTAFGNSKVFHPQVVESLDSSDDKSNFSETSESCVPSVASKDRSSFLEGNHKLEKSLTRDDINFMAGMKANYRRYLAIDPTTNNEVKPPAMSRSHLATPPDTVCIAVGRKSRNVYIDSDGDIDNETVMVFYNSDGAIVKTVSTKCSHHVESRKNRQAILQDPFSGIQVFSEVPLDEEGYCFSSEDDNDMDEAMDDEDHGFLIFHGVEKKPSLMYGMLMTLMIQMIWILRSMR